MLFSNEKKGKYKNQLPDKVRKDEAGKYKREEGVLMGKIYVIIVVLVLAAICGIYLLKTYKH